jgi:hypothetical protein
MRIVVLVVLLASSVASADPIVVDVGVGAAAERWRDELNLTTNGTSDAAEPFAGALTLYVDVGYHVHRDLALELHGGVSSQHTVDEFIFDEDPMPGDQDSQLFQYRAYELGVGVEYAFADRFWVSPWVGFVKLATNLDDFSVDATLAAGLELGVDLYARDGNHLGLFAKATYAKIRADKFAGDGSDYSQLAFGLAFRRW